MFVERRVHGLARGEEDLRCAARPAAERNGLLRVVDESGEEYLYARERFVPPKLSRGLQQALAVGR